MQINSSSNDRVEIVTLTGRLTMSETERAIKCLTDLLQQGRNLIVLDLENLEFVDSSGLAVFISYMKRTQQAGGKVALSALQPPVRSVLQLTRLHQVLDIFDSTQAAVDKLNQESATFET